MAKTSDDLPINVTEAGATRSVEDRIEELRKKKKAALTPGGRDSAKKQHDRGKLTARERLELLLDPGSFVETDPFVVHRSHDFGMDRNRPPTDGVVTGWGTIDGRKVFVVRPGLHGVRRLARRGHGAEDLQDHGPRHQRPARRSSRINDSGGARIQEGAARLAGYGYIFDRNVRASGVIPQISVDHGARAPAARPTPPPSPTSSFMVKETSHMFITGPDVIKAVTGEEVTFEELGGAMTHASRSGVASFVAQTTRTRCLAGAVPAQLPALEQPRGPARVRAPTDDPGRRDEGLTHIVPDSREGARTTCTR